MVKEGNGKVRARLALFVVSFGFFFMTTPDIWGKSTFDPKVQKVDDWIAWRDNQIARIFTPTVETSEGPILSREEVIRRSSDAYRILLPHLTEPQFNQSDSAVANQLRNFISFVKAQTLMVVFDSEGMYTHALGYDVTDIDYWHRSASELQIPALLRSPAFLKAMSRPETYRDAVSLIDRQNIGIAQRDKWQVLTYRSRFLKSPDATTYGRMLVFIPNMSSRDGGFVDRWVQFAITVPDGPSDFLLRHESLSVSVVAVHQGGNDSSHSIAFLGDFMRIHDRATGQFSVVPNVTLTHNPSKNCYDCHKSPVLPIHPKVEYGFGSDGRLDGAAPSSSHLSAILNARIAEYGKVNFAHMDTEAFGPTVGPLGQFRSDRFLISASSVALASESLARVRTAMNCAKCHQSSPVNYPVGVRSNIGTLIFEEKKDLMRTYIEQGWMPPGNDLSSDERTALWRCLSKEYFDPVRPSGLLVDWLKGR